MTAALPRLAIPVAVALLALGTPLAARDSLGVFSAWGAFRDAQVARCYAIAKAQKPAPNADYEPFASVGTWPKRDVRNQLHIRLSRKVSPAGQIVLRIGSENFALVGGGGDAWAQDRRMDAAVIAAMRSAGSMTITARDRNGRSFTDRYSLAGAATAMDAASVGCAKLK